MGEEAPAALFRATHDAVKIEGAVIGVATGQVTREEIHLAEALAEEVRVEEVRVEEVRVEEVRVEAVRVEEVAA